MTTGKNERRPPMLLIGTNILTLAVAITFAYLYYNPPQPIIEDGGDCSTCVTTDYNPGFNGLNAILAKDMIRLYRNNHLQHIESNMTMGDGSAGGNGDARSVWFSMNTIKRFIHAIEKTVCDSCNSGNELGIRIYYAEYPSGERWRIYRDSSIALESMADTNMYGYHTVVMVPTFRDGGVDKDFDPRYWDGSCQPKTMDAVYHSIVKNDTTFIDPSNQALYMLLSDNNPETGETDPRVGMQNHGALIPPPYNDPESAGAGFMSLVDQFQ